MGNKQDLILSKPIMNAAGFMGFSPDRRRMSWLDRFGAFVTNPISLFPRMSAKNRVFSPFENGYILHSGLPNPGLGRIIHEHAKNWASSPIPVILHAMIEDLTEISTFTSRIEVLSGLGAIEFSFTPEIQSAQIRSGLSRLACELPVILNIDSERMLELMENIHQFPISAISLRNPRRTFSNPSGEQTVGRYYSRTLLAQTVDEVHELKDLGIPIYAGAGVSTDDDVKLLLNAGASAVQLDSILWD